MKEVKVIFLVLVTILATSTVILINNFKAEATDNKKQKTENYIKLAFARLHAWYGYDGSHYLKGYVYTKTQENSFKDNQSTSKKVYFCDLTDNTEIEASYFRTDDKGRDVWVFETPKRSIDDKEGYPQYKFSLKLINNGNEIIDDNNGELYKLEWYNKAPCRETALLGDIKMALSNAYLKRNSSTKEMWLNWAIAYDKKSIKPKKLTYYYSVDNWKTTEKQEYDQDTLMHYYKLNYNRFGFADFSSYMYINYRYPMPDNLQFYLVLEDDEGNEYVDDNFGAYYKVLNDGYDRNIDNQEN